MDGGGSRRRLPGRQAQGRKERDLPGSCRQEERRDCGREGGKLGGGGGARRPGTGGGVPAPPPFLPLSPNLNLVNLTSQFLFLLFLFSFASSLSLSLRRLVTTAFFFFLFKGQKQKGPPLPPVYSLEYPPSPKSRMLHDCSLYASTRSNSIRSSNIVIFSFIATILSSYKSKFK